MIETITVINHVTHFEFITGLGMFNATGDMDFYPNGGKHMVGCNDVKQEQEQEQEGKVTLSLFS